MKFEMHTHVLPSSIDSSISAKEAVETIKQNKYGGLVLTDHYDSDTLTQLDNEAGIDVQNRKWLQGFYNVKEEAHKAGLIALLGMEYTLEYVSRLQHILLYGELEALVANGVIRPYLKLEELKDICTVNDILMIQAHPYRYGDHMLSSIHVDGYEILNTKPENTRSYVTGYNYRCSKELSNRTGLINISGGDCHNIKHLGKAGIDTIYDVYNMDGLCEALRDGLYTIIDNTAL